MTEQVAYQADSPTQAESPYQRLIGKLIEEHNRLDVKLESLENRLKPFMSTRDTIVPSNSTNLLEDSDSPIVKYLTHQIGAVKSINERIDILLSRLDI